MKQLLSVISLAAVLLTLGVQQAVASDITYSLGQATQAYGTSGKNAETYDVGLRISDPALIGAQIKGVRIGFADTQGVSNAKAWLTVALPAIKSSKAQEPDITSKAFEASEEYTEVLFDEPYTITSDGVYVGYSFDVEKADEAPRPVLLTSTSTPDGFYIHSTKIFRTAWRSRLANDLAIEVLLSGDQFRPNAATAADLREVNTQTGEATQTDFSLTNHGTQGIQSIDYQLTIAGQTIDRHVDLEQPVPAIYGGHTTLNMTLPPISAKGAYTLELAVTRVNGVPNEEATAPATGLVNVYNTLPVHRAVVEEYTGTWCGYCPRGFVGLEEMNRLYPDDFIAISYHNGDPMQITTTYPNNVAGFPDAWLDRVRQTDAFCGDSEYGTFGIDKVWLERCQIFAPASLGIATQWVDDATLEATAYATFPLDRDDCPYELGFVLTSDGLTGSGSKWSQSNYYSGDSGWPSSMEAFTQGSSYVDGLVFNDVIIARSGIAGIEGSLSAPIQADVAQSFTYRFDVASLGDVLVQDRAKLRVIVLLINRETGEILNANKAMAGSSTTGVASTATSADKVVARTVYYDLQGRPVGQARHGIFLKAETLNDGTLRTSKVVRK